MKQTLSISNVLSLVLFVGLAFSMTSCEKKVEGCMDSQALDYNNDAEEEGACAFSSVVFRFNNDDVFGADSSVVTVEMDGNVVGTMTGTNDDPIKSIKTSLSDANRHLVTSIIRSYSGSNDSIPTYNVVHDTVKASPHQASIEVNIPF